MATYLDPDRPAGNIRVYIDNSNLWIQGQKTYAARNHSREQWDPTWRFDVGRLKDVLLEESGLLPDQKRYTFEVRLYGSTPPPVDTVWRAIESHNVKVSTFARSSWTGREKEVDAEMIADAVDEGSDDYHGGVDSVFMIVSGDRDLARAVQKSSQKYMFPVHVWSWKNALATVYRQSQLPGVHAHYLDNYLDDIGFRETTFRLDRNVFDPQSIVVIDALPEAERINEYLFNLPVPIYSYLKRHDGDVRPDLIIIPAFAHIMTYEAKERLFVEVKGRLQALGVEVLTYFEYNRSDGSDPEIIVETSNRFQELPEGSVVSREEEREPGDNRPQPGGSSSTDDGFVEVNMGARRQKARLQTIENKSRSRCDWRLYCHNGLGCKFGHTDDERSHFRLMGSKRPKKIKLCEKPQCTLGARCNFAHGEAELFCPTCDRSRAGHYMWDCPNKVR